MCYSHVMQWNNGPKIHPKIYSSHDPYFLRWWISIFLPGVPESKSRKISSVFRFSGRISACTRFAEHIPHHKTIDPDSSVKPSRYHAFGIDAQRSRRRRTSPDTFYLIYFNWSLLFVCGIFVCPLFVGLSAIGRTEGFFFGNIHMHHIVLVIRFRLMLPASFRQRTNIIITNKDISPSETSAKKHPTVPHERVSESANGRKLLITVAHTHTHEDLFAANARLFLCAQTNTINYVNVFAFYLAWNYAVHIR